MLRGLYTAASGMIAQQRRHDTVTNNIANLNTPGFKSNNALNRSFPDMLISAIGGPNTREGSVGRLSTGVFAEENILSMAQGDISETNRPQDMALVSDISVREVLANAAPEASFDASGKYVDPNGNVTYQPQPFFTIQTPEGERYTRDGSFHTAPDGTLLTSENMPVLGANNQPIVIDTSWEDIAVQPNGALISKSTGLPLNGDPQLGITLVDNPNNMLREGDGRFRYAGDPAGKRQVGAADRVEIRQGYLERSNVDASQSAIDIMSALRAYEANQKVIQFYDKSLEKAVNEVGRV